MMTKEREVLQRILDTDPKFLGGRFIAEIEELLAQPECEPLTPQQISEGNQSMFNVTREAFKQGVEFAEKPTV
jgi:hypothetical protein